MCAIQKLKIHLIAHYSNARSLWKGIPALRCHVQNMSNASALRQAVMSHCYRLVFRLNFIVTVELLYDQAESDFVHWQTKMPAFASRICSEIKQIELNWNRLVRQYALWSLVFSLFNPTMKQTNLRVGCRSALQPGTMTGRRSETFTFCGDQYSRSLFLACSLLRLKVLAWDDWQFDNKLPTL